MSGLHKQQNPYKKESSVHCDVCNVWVANHAQAIRNHELGESHKKRLDDSACLRALPASARADALPQSCSRRARRRNRRSARRTKRRGP